MMGACEEQALEAARSLRRSPPDTPVAPAPIAVSRFLREEALQSEANGVQIPEPLPSKDQRVRREDFRDAGAKI